MSCFIEFLWYVWQFALFYIADLSVRRSSKSNIDQNNKVLVIQSVFAVEEMLLTLLAVNS